MTNIVIASTKGGVGKTTTATALASALANLECTLLVDLDPQGQVTLHFGLPLRSGLYHWLMDELPLADCTYQGRPPALRILPGDSMSKSAQREFARDGSPTRLAGRFSELGILDGDKYIVFDTGGTGGFLAEAALTIADQVIIPFHAEMPGVDGLYASLEVVNQLAPTAKVTLLPVAFDRRLTVHRENLAILRKEMPERGELVEEFAIRNRAAVPGAVEVGQTIWEYNGGSIVDVRVGYSYLVGRVLSLAGADFTQKEVVERLSYASKNKAH
jgi:chromosome partitioning protein